MTVEEAFAGKAKYEPTDRRSVEPEPLKQDAPTADGGDLDAASRLKLELNDRDNAKRLHAELREKLLFVSGLGWGVWDGQRFDFDAGEAMVLKVASEALPKAIRDEAAAKSAVPAPEHRVDSWLADHPGKPREAALKVIRALEAKKYRNVAIQAGNNRVLKPALEHARAHFICDITDLDADPWRLVCANGVVDLRKAKEPAPDAEEPEEAVVRKRGWLGPFDPSMKNTRVPTVAFDPTADCPRWSQFVARIFPDPTDAAYSQRCMAATLGGRNEHQAAIIFLGQGGNGKSTAASALKTVLRGYAASCRIELFVESRNQSSGAATPEEAVLPGARAYIASEPETGAVLSASRIKGLTGGEPRQSRAMYGRPFTWVPHGVPVLSFNKMPRVTDESEGMWRRLITVPFNVVLHQLPMEQRIAPYEMERAITEEASGILNWLLGGWVDLAERGFDPPPEALKVKADLREIADPVGTFLKDRTERDPVGRVRTKDLHDAFEEWCEAQGSKFFGASHFRRQLSAIGIRRIKNVNHYYVGLRLTTDEGSVQ